MPLANWSPRSSSRGTDSNSAVLSDPGLSDARSDARSDAARLEDVQEHAAPPPSNASSEPTTTDSPRTARRTYY